MIVNTLKSNGLAILNLGCGQRAHPEMNNLDYSTYAKLAKNKLLRRVLKAAGFITLEREEMLSNFNENIVLHDLTKGIPFPDGTFDVVYHSHFLEHLTKEDGYKFLTECALKLKIGGVLRVAVPDLEVFAKNYLSSLTEAVENRSDICKTQNHEHSTWRLLQQFVVTETVGTAKHNKWRRVIENLILGDRRKRGDMHLWMYDRFSLVKIFEELGLKDVHQCKHIESRIPTWDKLFMDNNVDGTPYKLDTIYVEGVREK